MTFTADNWMMTRAFSGRVATPEDVTAGDAVFALGDTEAPEPLDLGAPLPRPAIWSDDQVETAVLVVQAEIHDTAEGDTLQPLGMMLPRGRTVVGFLDEVDFVEPTDPVWRALVEDALFSTEDAPS